MEAFSAMLDNKLGPLQSSVDSMNQKLESLNTRMTTNEQGLNWCYNKFYSFENSLQQAALVAADAAVKKHIGAELENAALEAVEKQGADVSQTVEALQAQVQELQQRGPAPTGSKTKTKNPKQMSEKEQILEICDKIELRFPEGVAEPDNDEAAKQLIEQVLNSIMTDMASSHAEFARKWMARQGEGRKQLRMWLRFPNSAERNVLFDKLTTKADGKWTARASLNGTPVAAHKPNTRDMNQMMTEMIRVAGRLAGRLDISHSDIKEKLPIHPQRGTIHYEGKLVAYYKWEDHEGQIIVEKKASDQAS